MNTLDRELTDKELYEIDGLHREYAQKYGMNDVQVERRKPYGGLTEQEVEEIVGRVSQRVLNNFYQEIGRNVMKRILQILGILAVSTLMWLTGNKLKVW